MLSFSLSYSVQTKKVEDSEFWMESGKLGILESLKNVRIEGTAKNLILFVGDGMGMSTITAGRIYRGQLDGKLGEETFLSFEKFRNVGLLKTYNVDRQVPDSAGTATALFSGIKGNYYTVGLDGTAQFNVCRTDVEEKARVKTLMDWGIEAGKHTGLVTTTRITHATPAAAYAHSAHRDWECDTKIPLSEIKQGCKDISRQLVEDDPGRKINVVLGGGEQTLRQTVTNSTTCTRGDGKDLIQEWIKYQSQTGQKFAHVHTREELLAVKEVDHLLGIFSLSHIPYDKDRGEEHPSLQEMTTKAIELLSRNPLGYVLIVEGGRIDHAHHDNLAKIALEEVVAFDKAITKALEITNEKDTLIVVTADHSHSFSINGYPTRGNPIEGIAYVTPEGFPFQTLSYINGPGYNYHRSHPTSMTQNMVNSTSSLKTWKNLNESKEDNGKRSTPHHAGYWMDYETHAGEDVPVYASGPMAHLFHGVHEQTHVPHVMSYSACIGPYIKGPHCERKEQVDKSSCDSFSRDLSYTMILPFLILTWFHVENL